MSKHIIGVMCALMITGCGYNVNHTDTAAYTVMLRQVDCSKGYRAVDEVVEQQLSIFEINRRFGGLADGPVYGASEFLDGICYIYIPMKDHEMHRPVKLHELEHCLCGPGHAENNYEHVSAR